MSAPTATGLATPLRIGPALRRWAIPLILAALVALFQSAEPAFLRVANLFSVLQAVSVTTLLGVGITLTLAVGGFDLSAGSVAAFSMMAASYGMVGLGLGAAGAVLLCLVLGALIGLANGLLIVRLRIPDLLATLGTSFLLAGLQLIPTGGRSIATGMVLPSGETASGAFDPIFLAIGRVRIGDVVPLPVILAAIAVLVAWAVMERTRWGRVLYAVGGNEVAARLAGAPVGAYRVAAYVASAMTASLGGVVLAARVGRGDVSTGTSLLLDAVAAALIGFAVLDARRPHVAGTAVGAVFVGVLLNGLTMLNTPYLFDPGF
jgi:simple sugar transport system permease protein